MAPLAEGRGHFLVPTVGLIEMVVGLGALFATACALVAAPCWLLLRKLRVAGWISAAILGVALGEACALVLGDAGTELLVVLGLAGGLAGLASRAADNALTAEGG